MSEIDVGSSFSNTANVSTPSSGKVNRSTPATGRRGPKTPASPRTTAPGVLLARNALLTLLGNTVSHLHGDYLLNAIRESPKFPAVVKELLALAAALDKAGDLPRAFTVASETLKLLDSPPTVLEPPLLHAYREAAATIAAEAAEKKKFYGKTKSAGAGVPLGNQGLANEYWAAVAADSPRALKRLEEGKLHLTDVLQKYFMTGTTEKDRKERLTVVEKGPSSPSYYLDGIGKGPATEAPKTLMEMRVGSGLKNIYAESACKLWDDLQALPLDKALSLAKRECFARIGSWNLLSVSAAKSSETKAAGATEVVPAAATLETKAAGASKVLPTGSNSPINTAAAVLATVANTATSTAATGRGTPKASKTKHSESSATTTPSSGASTIASSVKTPASGTAFKSAATSATTTPPASGAEKSATASAINTAITAASQNSPLHPPLLEGGSGAGPSAPGAHAPPPLPPALPILKLNALFDAVKEGHWDVCAVQECPGGEKMEAWLDAVGTAAKANGSNMSFRAVHIGAGYGGIESATFGYDETMWSCEGVAALWCSDAVGPPSVRGPVQSRSCRPSRRESKLQAVREYDGSGHCSMCGKAPEAPGAPPLQVFHYEKKSKPPAAAAAAASASLAAPAFEGTAIKEKELTGLDEGEGEEDEEEEDHEEGGEDHAEGSEGLVSADESAGASSNSSSAASMPELPPRRKVSRHISTEAICHECIPDKLYEIGKSNTANWYVDKRCLKTHALSERAFAVCFLKSTLPPYHTLVLISVHLTPSSNKSEEERVQKVGEMRRLAVAAEWAEREASRITGGRGEDFESPAVVILGDFNVYGPTLPSSSSSSAAAAAASSSMGDSVWNPLLLAGFRPGFDVKGPSTNIYPLADASESYDNIVLRCTDEWLDSTPEISTSKMMRDRLDAFHQVQMQLRAAQQAWKIFAQDLGMAISGSDAALPTIDDAEFRNSARRHILRMWSDHIPVTAKIFLSDEEGTNPQSSFTRLEKLDFETEAAATAAVTAGVSAAAAAANSSSSSSSR